LDSNYQFDQRRPILSGYLVTDDSSPAGDPIA
jgi:hypothetical protein